VERGMWLRKTLEKSVEKEEQFSIPPSEERR
jgi:hypothetical protein